MRAVFLCLALAGCATISLQPFSQGMDRLRGQPVQAAFDRLGYPQNEKQIAGKTVYYWTENFDCTFNIVTSGGVIESWSGVGSPAACSIYLRGLSR